MRSGSTRKGRIRIEAVIRVALDGAPSSVTLDNRQLASQELSWDQPTKTLLIRFPNSPNGHWLVIR